MLSFIPRLLDVALPTPYEYISNFLRNESPIAMLASFIVLVLTAVGTWFAANFKK